MKPTDESTRGDERRNAAVVAAQTYTTTRVITAATYDDFCEAMATFWMHLCHMRRRLAVNAFMTAMVVNADHTVTFNFTAPLPLDAEQLAHLGIA